jgi:hypothetical protein
MFDVQGTQIAILLFIFQMVLLLDLLAMDVELGRKIVDFN